MRGDYSLFANLSGLSGVRFSFSFPRYVRHRPYFVLTYPSCVLLRLPERILAPIPTLSSKSRAPSRKIDTRSVDLQVSLEYQYSLNPRLDFLRVTAHTIDPPQERVKEVQVRFENRCRRRG